MQNKLLKKGFVFGIIVLFVGAGMASANGGIFKLDVAKDIQSIKTENVTSWTYMAYWVGDMTVNSPEGKKLPGDVGMLRVLNTMELSGSTSEVNIIVQADDYNIWGGDQGAFGGTRRYYIKHDENLNELANYTLNEDVWYLEEQNMGDPQTLVDFITWATSNYPAEHYLLMLFSHGAGWIGMCQDETTGNILNPDSIISISELKSALSSCIHPDILFTYGCMMGQIEVFYELKNCADIILAGESTMGGSRNMINASLKELTSNPQLTPVELAQIFVDNYKFGDDYYTVLNWCPLFGVQSNDIDNTTQAVDSLAEAVIKQYQTKPLEARLMLYSAFKHSTMVLQVNRSKQTDLFAHELYEFVERIADLSKNRMSNIYNTALEVLSAIDNSSIIKPSVNPNENFHGMSIFSPPYHIVYRLTKNMYKSTDFTKDTKWDELLNLYYFWSY